jgi:hypothetical protein
MAGFPAILASSRPLLPPPNRSCLREDQSTCFQPGDANYEITHNGLDAMITRWMDTFTAFAHLPDELAFANHTLYKFLNDVGGRDMVEGGRGAVVWGSGAGAWFNSQPPESPGWASWVPSKSSKPQLPRLLKPAPAFSTRPQACTLRSTFLRVSGGRGKGGGSRALSERFATELLLP